jgi:hypothetical protein
MKYALTLLYLLPVAAFGQMPVEIFIGNRNYWYQHSIGVTFRESKFGISHVSSMYFFFAPETPDEIMSQVYLTYEVTPWLSAGAGTFYATGPGFSPSFSMQFRKKTRSLTVVAVPRVDVRKAGSVELMTFVEYTPRITDSVSFYSRFQAMSNYTSRRHNRSYQAIRIGVSIGKVRTGLALNVDEYGREAKTMHNAGVFFITLI